MIEDEEDDFDIDLELHECRSCGEEYDIENLDNGFCFECIDNQEYYWIRSH